MDFESILDHMIFGEEIEFKGKKYQHIKTLNNGFILVIKSGSVLPAQTYIIKKQEGDNI